jgi:hypothetical protein
MVVVSGSFASNLAFGAFRHPVYGCLSFPRNGPTRRFAFASNGFGIGSKRHCLMAYRRWWRPGMAGGHGLRPGC